MGRIVVLGRSEGFLVNLFDTFQALGESGRVTVVRNLADPVDPFSVPTHLPCEERDWDAWEPLPDDRYALGAGHPQTRAAIHGAFAERFGLADARFPAWVHPSATVGYGVEIGPGAWIDAGARIAPCTGIGPHAVVRANAYVGHHVVVGTHAAILPGATVGGYCRIGNGAQISIGATVIDRCVVGDGAVVGAGSVVVSEIPAGVVAYGVPARVARSREVAPA